MLTREGAHSRNRILHANGDATGREIGRALLARASATAGITLLPWTLLTDLLTTDGRVSGARLLDENGEVRTVHARAVLLASGGAGQVYSDTTNPAVATGDGIAAAHAAGAELADMEFYQFHPTALSLPGVPRFLLSEALRGEGAWLVNAAGERFMQRYHPLLELAPRDVVARAITREGMGGQPVYLDMRHVTGIDPDLRFPGISVIPAPARPRSCARSDSRAARRALPDGRCAHRCGWADITARPLCGRRSGLYGRARRKPPGQQLAARRAGLRRARRGEHAERERRSCEGGRCRGIVAVAK